VPTDDGDPSATVDLSGVVAGPGPGDPFLAALRAELPTLRISQDPVDLEANRRDETAYLRPPMPLAVAWPTSTGEVAALVRLAAAYGQPIVPRGAGTGLSGGAVGVDGAVTVNLTRMNRILEIDEENRAAIVQPGVINADLKAAVAAHDLFYAPDPASYETCSIGGNVATNSGGLCCVKYGVTRDAVLALEVVLADGSVIRTGGRNVKDAAGYDLAGLFVGSMGTLGIVTEATLRLLPTPPARQTMLAFFPSIEAAGLAVAGMVRAGIQPVTLELMDAFTIRAVNAAYDLGLDESAAAMLMVESDLPGASGTAELDAAEAASTVAGATFQIRSRDASEADLLRQGRRMAHYALERFGVSRMEDVVVPRSRVPDLLHAIREIGERRGLRIGVFGHAGDGNLHPSFVFERDDQSGEALMESARDELYRTAIGMGGSVTGEHGIGVSRKAWLELQRGPDAMRVMRSVKAALDPLNILNPGKVL
jgi:glycolate oxidase